MADNYLELVNKLRDRFNEVRLTSSTWSTTVGFDQFSKAAINYAYHDILNAEMQWPFLHQSTTIKTIPGIQFYTPTLTAPAGFTSPAELKQIDYESFYISENAASATVSNESHTIASDGTVTPTNATTWQSDLGVTYTSGGASLTPVTGDPSTGQYTIIAGIYQFNTGEAGTSVNINYTTQTDSSLQTIINPQHLAYIDYDFWRQAYLSTDKDAQQTAQKMPQYVFKTNNMNEIGLSPNPDKIYIINFEYWLDGLDLSNTTDTPLLPTHYYQILIDGAQKYCYEFREDPQMAALADKRFQTGISRMRTELINRQATMRAGIYWYPHGHSYSNNSFR